MREVASPSTAGSASFARSRVGALLHRASSRKLWVDESYDATVLGLIDAMGDPKTQRAHGTCSPCRTRGHRRCDRSSQLNFEVIYDGVNVHSGPGVEYTVIEQLKAGTKLKGTRLHSWSAWVEVEPGQWCAMTFNLEAFMKVAGSGALNKLPVSNTAGAIPLPSLRLEVTNDFLRVRSGPGTECSEVAQLIKGNKITARQIFAPRA